MHVKPVDNASNREDRNTNIDRISKRAKIWQIKHNMGNVAVYILIVEINIFQMILDF